MLGCPTQPPDHVMDQTTALEDHTHNQMEPSLPQDQTFRFFDAWKNVRMKETTDGYFITKEDHRILTGAVETDKATLSSFFIDIFSFKKETSQKMSLLMDKMNKMERNVTHTLPPLSSSIHAPFHFSSLHPSSLSSSLPPHLNPNPSAMRSTHPANDANQKKRRRTTDRYRQSLASTNPTRAAASNNGAASKANPAATGRLTSLSHANSRYDANDFIQSFAPRTPGAMGTDEYPPLPTN